MDLFRALLEDYLPFAFLGDPAEQLFPVLLALTRGWVGSVQGIELGTVAWRQELVLGDRLTVEFWPEDPNHPEQVLGTEAVSLEMMRNAMLMTAKQRMSCLSRMTNEGRMAS
jgi:hypothetical protein